LSELSLEKEPGSGSFSRQVGRSAAHREEKPLDAFINAVNFYIRPPRFALMLRKRLEIVLENVAGDEDLAKLQTFTLESGEQVTYPSSEAAPQTDETCS
jgi:hypothetical protein